MPELAPRVFDASIHPGSILWTPNIVLVSMGNSIPMNTTRAGPQSYPRALVAMKMGAQATGAMGLSTSIIGVASSLKGLT